MKFVDPSKAVANRAAIKLAILEHTERVVKEGIALGSLDLSSYGLRLEPEDFSPERAANWTKKTTLQYREEVVVLSGLWRSIAVRTNSKKREQNYRDAARRVI